MPGIAATSERPSGEASGPVIGTDRLSSAGFRQRRGQPWVRTCRWRLPYGRCGYSRGLDCRWRRSCGHRTGRVDQDGPRPVAEQARQNGLQSPCRQSIEALHHIQTSGGEKALDDGLQAVIPLERQRGETKTTDKRVDDRGVLGRAMALTKDKEALCRNEPIQRLDSQRIPLGRQVHNCCSLYGLLEGRASGPGALHVRD